jgi:uncharacterized membrane protein
MATPATQHARGRTGEDVLGGLGIRRDQPDVEQVARGLGWFSVVLGSIEFLAPGAVARAIGAGDSAVVRAATRVCGLREIASGLGILTTPRPAGWVTSRMAGDIMDLAMLGVALALPSARRGRLLAAGAAILGVTVLDATCAQRLREASGRHGRAVRARRSLTINRPAEELYRVWRHVSNLPRFMRRIESVHATGDRRSHWIARGPFGMRVEWDAEITEDRPNQAIAWRSLSGSPIDTAGAVRFSPAPGGRGTEVTVELEYSLPGRAVSAQLARLLGQAPEQQLQEDLRRFKQLLETGQIIESEGAGGRR